MAITKEEVLAKIEIVGESKHIQYAKDIYVKEDGVTLSKTRWRRALQCGHLNPSDEFVDTDISEEPSEVQEVCNQQWTQAVKDAYKTLLLANKN